MKKEYVVELSEEEADELMDEHWVGELVRCKDCKYRSKEMYDRYGNPNNKVYVCQINDVAKKPEWFCADGERGGNE